MSDHRDSVPLNVWPIVGHDGSTIRAALAARAITEYSPEGGLVADLWPGDFEAVAAAARTNRHAAAIQSWGSAAAIAGRVDLVLVLPLAERLAGPSPWAMHPDETAALAGQARRLLRPGGFLTLGVVSRPGADEVGTATAAAAGAGLGYFQHVLAIAGAWPESADARTVVGRIDVLVFRRPE